MDNHWLLLFFYSMDQNSNMHGKAGPLFDDLSHGDAAVHSVFIVSEVIFCTYDFLTPSKLYFVKIIITKQQIHYCEVKK